MSSFGVTDTGFIRKRLDQLLEELDAAVKGVFGENFNVSPESPDGQINGIVSESNANLWEIAEQAYNAFNPSAASGVTLSNLVQLNGITRLPAVPSRVELTITGTAGTVIPVDSLVSTAGTGNQFATEADVAIGPGGTVIVFANATEVGRVEALAGTVTEIDTPITGWASVTNVADATVGTLEETDVELRARRQRSVARDAQAIVDSIFAAVANVPGVTKTVVLENDTDATDANGLPPHSFQVIAEGGDDDAIAQVIWLKKPAGILSFGNVTVTINDSQGLPHDISFTRPTNVDIYVEVDLLTGDGYPPNGDDLIKQAIVDYVEGRLISGRGFTLAEDVIYTRLYTPINTAVDYHEITGLRIGTAPAPVGTANIAIGPTEASRLLVDNIVINA